MERTPSVNNAFYDELKERWLSAKDHPIALLRAENRIRIPWILSKVQKGSRVLDIGCGAGFLTHALDEAGHTVSGIDLSESSLEIARLKSPRVDYQKADAYALPYPNDSFDCVFAMDVLEHVDDPAQLIQEASRVLKPKGLFFFHTFNRTPLSYLLVIKGVEWTVANTPKRMHLYSHFIKPNELRAHLKNCSLFIEEISGFIPKLFSLAFLRLLFTRRVSDRFSFAFSKTLLTGYCGYANKRPSTTDSKNLFYNPNRS